MKSFSVASMLSVLLFSCVAGCGPGGPEIGAVEGTVTLDGEPLVDASVVFTPQAGGRPAGSKTDSEGKYQLNFSAGRKGTIPGPNIVRVYMLSDPYEDEDGTMIPGRPETIPARYNADSELTFDVKSDEPNIADFDLESGGEVITGDEDDS